MHFCTLHSTFLFCNFQCTCSALFVPPIYLKIGPLQVVLFSLCTQLNPPRSATYFNHTLCGKSRFCSLGTNQDGICTRMCKLYVLKEKFSKVQNFATECTLSQVPLHSVWSAEHKSAKNPGKAYCAGSIFCADSTF